jgi:Glycosyl hydrolases family 38 N-terminal domain/Alpha mannosidase middle domain
MVDRKTMTIIHVVPHQHFDLVWRRDVAWYNQRRDQLYTQVLELMRKYSNFTYTFSQAMPIREFLNKHPELRDEFATYLNSGRFEIIGGSESICDLNMTSPAAIMNNIESGMKYFSDEFKYKVTVGAFEDAFGVPEQLPAILKTVGYRFYKAGRMPRPGQPDLNGNFIWRAKGSDAVRCISPGNECSDWGWGYPDNPDDPTPVTMEERRAKVLARLMLAVNNSDPHVLYSVMGEEHDIVDGLPELLEEASVKTGAKYIFSTYNNYYDSLSEKYWQDVPCYDAETDVSRLFTGCYTSRINSKLAPRKLEYSIVAYNFASLTQKVDKLPREVSESLYLLQFHDAVCGCHIDENADKLNVRFQQSRELVPSVSLTVPFKSQLPDFHSEQKTKLKFDSDTINFGDFTINIKQDKLCSVKYHGKELGSICELSAREDSGTLWTEEYSSKKRAFAELETIESINSGENTLEIITKLSCEDFKTMWPGFSMLKSRKHLTFNKESSCIAVEFEIFWLGSATELAVRWTAAGDNLDTCTAETPFGSRKRVAYKPSADTMSGDVFPVLNWCSTEQVAIFNRGTPGHALREGGLETIILRSPVKRWSPWFPVTPTDQSRDNGEHVFEFIVDMDGGEKSLSDLHREGIEYNLGDNAQSIDSDAFACLPENIVIADARKDLSGQVHALLFEAEGRDCVWKDYKLNINELFNPYKIKRYIINDGSKINTPSSVRKRRRTVSPIA